ncbi:MAG: glycosyltransferase [Desulfomonilia bacterium]|jgi:glycosyltransferase involved in cell wall biosynthesis|nr:glycosyltransferase [Desulfomonilia bacterium]
MNSLALIIDKLDRGGAECQFVHLARSLDRKRFAISVIVLNPEGELFDDIKKLNDVQVIIVPRKGILNSPFFLVNMYSALKKIRPDVIYGYMGGTNELCLMMAKLVRAKIVWGIRSSNMNLEHYGWKPRFLFRLGALLSRYADLLIINSFAGRDYYKTQGYAPERMVVIHNGIDTDVFTPDRAAGASFRQELGIKDKEILIGHVGRIDPMKDHSSFLHAASLLVRERKGIRFVCVGKDNPPLSGELKGLSKELELGKILSWTGSRTDMKAVYNGIDILTSSSSFGEGFPNVIGEAMACSRICVVTDVGDSSFIVGKTGEVVPPGDPHALADAWKKMMGLSPKERQTQGEKARKRVLENFTIECLVKNTAEHILSILARF